MKNIIEEKFCLDAKALQFWIIANHFSKLKQPALILDLYLYDFLILT